MSNNINNSYNIVQHMLRNRQKLIMEKVNTQEKVDRYEALDDESESKIEERHQYNQKNLVMNKEKHYYYRKLDREEN